MPTPPVALIHSVAHRTDPRLDRTNTHRLRPILAITLCPTLADADTAEEGQRFGNAKRDWLQRFGELPNASPSHDTCHRVCAALDSRK